MDGLVELLDKKVDVIATPITTILYAVPISAVIKAVVNTPLYFPK